MKEARVREKLYLYILRSETIGSFNAQKINEAIKITHGKSSLGVDKRSERRCREFVIEMQNVGSTRK